MQKHTHQAVLLPGLGEFGPLFLPGYQDLHVLKRGVVSCLCLEGHLVVWHRFSYSQARKRGGKKRIQNRSEWFSLEITLLSVNTHYTASFVSHQGKGRCIS